MTRSGCGLAVLIVACSVDRGVLEDRIFACASDADCAAGFVCQIVDSAGAAFCAPAAGPEDCEGVTTPDGACIAECSLDSPASASGCRDGEDCLRSDVMGDAGLCLATQTCTVDSDCGSGEHDRCLSSYVLDGAHPFVLDHLSCVRGECDRDLDGEDDEGTCLDNEVCVAASWTSVWGGIRSMCLPTCGDGGLCPPGFGCYSVNGEDFGPCIPGVPWMTCRDDLDCLAGSCEDVNGELRCRLPCELGDSVACGDEPPSDEDAELERLVCVDGACVIRDYLAACGSDAACGAGFECRAIKIEEQEWDGCVLPCDLVRPNCPSDAFCTVVNDSLLDFAVGCVRELPDGIGCVDDTWCVSGFCDLDNPCDEKLPGCCAPRE